MADGTRGVERFLRLARFLQAVKLVGWDLPTDIGVYEDVHRGADGSSDFPRRVVPEVEVRQPFDEIELLKERHAGKRDATLRGNELPAECLNIFSDTHFKNVEDVGDVSTDVVCAKELYARAAQSAALYNISSALNQRYYYPMRRWERLQPVSGASVSATDAWFTALSAEAGYYAGVGDKLSEDMPTNVVDARQPVSLLRVSRMGKSRWGSIEPYLTAADRSTIFVMIASYRDSLCGSTIEDLIRKAKNVHRVHVGITQQNAVGDLSCLPDIVFTPIPCFALLLSPGDEASDEEVARRRVFSDGDSPIGSSHRLCFFHDNIRIREMLSTQARGPTFARYLNMLLYRGESLLMVLDSHNRFKPHWDSLVTNLYYQYEDPKAVLSHYPLSLTDYGRRASDSDFNEPLSYLCGAFFLEYLGYPVLSGSLTYFPEHHYSNLRYNDPYVVVQSKDIRPSENFRFPQPWAAAGFMFGSALIMREVPFDPHLSNIFMGEEILFSVRLWTHGYNMYSPIYSIVYHYYFREDSPKVWDELPLWSTLGLMSRKRIHYLLRSRVEPSKHAASNSSEAPLIVPPSTREAVVLLDVDRYGMGKVRTVEQWYDYAGVDPVNYTVDGRWCGKHQDTK
ncbi:unnamed protein product [Phytomonas sp. EM1]|nr:unnamed protein product [Phytomonas sp. EM1]|eukprot:CCW62890.1 unnamed protein product [Phytomonas sp. isolate EM1]